MPTLITHAVVAGAIGGTITKEKKPLRFWIIAVLCSVLPDADVIAFLIGIPYADFWGHRGFIHSILFAFLTSLFFASVFFYNYKIFSIKWLKYVLIFFLIGASHGILDAFTNGGLGIAVLSPFENTRYFAPWTPIQVSPIGLKSFFSYWGYRVLICEIKLIWAPALFIYFVSGFIKKRIDAGK